MRRRVQACGSKHSPLAHLPSQRELLLFGGASVFGLARHLAFRRLRAAERERPRTRRRRARRRAVGADFRAAALGEGAEAHRKEVVLLRRLAVLRGRSPAVVGLQPSESGR